MAETVETSAFDVRVDSGLGYEIGIGDVPQVDFADGDFVITDKNVFRLYGSLFAPVPRERLVVLPAGERSKTLGTLGRIVRVMRKAGCDRATRVVAVGGGVVGDLAGFVAAVYMRGVTYAQVPTTLLAMVDSAVGGKTAVDFDGCKNLLGAFKQPSAVSICTEFLRTLPERELTSGAGEIVKTALLDADLYAYLNASRAAFFAYERDCLRGAIERCVRFKASVVAHDEREAGLRRILNLGHTVGHALESADRYRRSHGEYVLNGILCETQLARAEGIVGEEYAKEIVTLCDLALGGRRVSAKCAAVVDCALADKKNRNGGIVCVLPVSPGVVKEIVFSPAEFRAAMEKLQ